MSLNGKRLTSLLRQPLEETDTQPAFLRLRANDNRRKLLVISNKRKVARLK